MKKAACTHTSWFKKSCIALLCWAGAGGGPVLAGQLDAGVGYALTHDSNVSGTNNVTADWTEQLFGGFGYQERSAELNARVLAQAERRHFVRNTFQDDNGFFLDGAAVWTISPRRFTWVLDDVFREMNTNPTAPNTPATLQKTNSLNTGPDYAFRVDPANVPMIGARYGRFYIQGPGGNDRLTGYARWLHQISLPTTVSLNFEATRVRFDPPQPNLSRQDLFFRYDLVQPFNRQTVDVGTTRLVPEGGQQLNGRLLRYAGQIASTSRSVLRLLLADETTDTYSELIRGVAPPTIPSIDADAAAAPVAASTVAVADIFHSRRTDLSYFNRGAGGFSYSLQGYTRHVDFETLDNFDYTEKGERLSMAWLLSIEVQAYASMQYMRRSFPNFGEVDADRNKFVGVTYKAGRSLTLTVEGGQTERQSTTNGIANQTTFVDRRVMLLLGYSTGPLFSARPRR